MSLTEKISRIKNFIALSIAAITLSACGFHLPNQTRINEVLPEINITGDYHEPFFHKVVNRLKANGVKVNAQSSSNDLNNADKNIPSLTIPKPNILHEIVSVDSRSQAIEKSIVVSISALLNIPNHRPILMRNSITRSALNKSGQALASDTEINTITDETLDVLATELVMRLSYLGRSSDPDELGPMPGELVNAKGEDVSYVYNPSDYEGVTLLEALQKQQQYEQTVGKVVSLEDLNNGKRILDKEYKLPNVKPEPLHQAPENAF